MTFLVQSDVLYRHQRHVWQIRPSRLTSSALQKVSASNEVLALVPILLLVGVRTATVGLLLIALVTSSVLLRELALRWNAHTLSGIQGFSVLASVLGLIAGVGMSEVVGPLLFASALLAIFALISGQSNRGPLSGDGVQVHRDSEVDYGKADQGLVAWLALALFLMGWQSLGFFAAGLALARVLRLVLKSSAGTVLRITVVFAGFVASYTTRHHFVGQYWVSVDQLWRATIASGLSRWGYSDFSGAAGTTLRYHWLSEATAGVIARLSWSSAVDGVTKILPAAGVLMCLMGLRHLGRMLGFNENTSLAAGLASIVVCKEFEVFSIGSLWGFGLYLAGLCGLARLAREVGANPCAQWTDAGLIVVITPLITLCQSTLGLHFTLLTATLALLALFQRRSTTTALIGVATLQVVLIGILRATLLASENSDMFSPSISLLNILQFRGVEIYDGDNWLLITASSVLFLLLLSQKGIGVLLLSESRSNRRLVVFALCITSSASLVPANLISMGGFESQQSRFLSPLQVLMTFVSIALILESLSREKTLHKFRNNKALGAVLAFVTVALVIAYQQIYGAPWSPKRSVGIALIILGGQAMALVVGWMFARGPLRSPDRKLIAIATFGCISLLANGRNLGNLLEYQLTATDSARAAEFVGSLGTQDCLHEVRRVADKDAIIASNWFRTPPPARRPKNFLVSAHTERRTYLDGPEYIGYFVDGFSNISASSDNWLDDRYQATDNFAERASKDAYDTLRAANVEYFVFETYMPAPPTWEPYADVIFERDSCKILKLRT